MMRAGSSALVFMGSNAPDAFLMDAQRSMTFSPFCPCVTITVFRWGRFLRISRILSRFAPSVMMLLASLLANRYSRASVPKRVKRGMAIAPIL